MTYKKRKRITEVMTEKLTEEMFYGSPAAIRGGPFSEAYLVTSMAPQLQSAAAHPRRQTWLLLWLPSCNPRRPILGGILGYLYGSPAAIRGGPFSEAYLAASMAPQLQSAAANSRRHTWLLLCSPAAIRGGPSSEAYLATSMAPELQSAAAHIGGILGYFYGSLTAVRGRFLEADLATSMAVRTMMTIDLFWGGGEGTMMMMIDLFYFWGRGDDDGDDCPIFFGGRGDDDDD